MMAVPFAEASIMARRHSSFDEGKIARFFKEGRVVGAESTISHG